VRAGQLGTVRKVLVEYTQGWLAEADRAARPEAGIWRLDPEARGS
jgi:hypothetical protein